MKATSRINIVSRAVLHIAPTHSQTIVLVSVLALLLCGTSQAQLILNGGFETWGTTTGSPPAGIPTSWTYDNAALPYQAPGIVAGSTHSVFLNKNAGVLSQVVTSNNVVNFRLDFVFAALDPLLTTYRSFNMSVNQGTVAANNSVLNLRTVRGSTAGKLTLQAYNGSAWAVLGADLFNASVYDSGSNSFTTLNAYEFSLTLDLSSTTPSYSIKYRKLGTGTFNTLPNLTSFYFTPSGASLYKIAFATGGSSAGYAIDDLTVSRVYSGTVVAIR